MAPTPQPTTLQRKLAIVRIVEIFAGAGTMTRFAVSSQYNVEVQLLCEYAKYAFELLSRQFPLVRLHGRACRC